MAAKKTYRMNYTSDIVAGGANNDGQYNLSFSMRAGYDDCILQNPQIYSDSGLGCVCGVSGLFTPRYLQAKFSSETAPGTPSRNCAVIKFPVPIRSSVLIASMVAQLKSCGAVCVDYIGEKWNTVPPAIGGYTPSSALFTVSAGVRSRKVSGVNIEYNSDALGDNQVANVLYEAEPFSLTGAVLTPSGEITPGADFENCHGELSQGAACSFGSSLKARKAILAFQYQVTPGAGVTGSTVLLPKRGSRGVPIASAADILGCIGSLGNISGVNCVGYEGESISRVDLFV
jgi:hypothetical protein